MLASLCAQSLVKVTSHLAVGEEDYSSAASWLREMPIWSESSAAFPGLISYWVMLATEC